MHWRYKRLLAGTTDVVITFIVLYTYAVRPPEDTLLLTIKRHPFYALTAVTSALMTMWHAYLFVASFFYDVHGWWYWRFPLFSGGGDEISFVMADDLWAFLWLVQLITQLLVPEEARTYPLATTASVTLLYHIQKWSASTCVHASAGEL